MYIPQYKFSENVFELVKSIFGKLGIEDVDHSKASSFTQSVSLKTLAQLAAKLSNDQKELIVEKLKKQDPIAASLIRSFFGEIEIKKEFMKQFKDGIDYFFAESGGNYSENKVKECETMVSDLLSKNQ